MMQISGKGRVGGRVARGQRSLVWLEIRCRKLNDRAVVMFVKVFPDFVF